MMVDSASVSWVERMTSLVDGVSLSTEYKEKEEQRQDKIPLRHQHEAQGTQRTTL